MSFKIPEAYELLRREELTDIGSAGYLLRHRRSGARVLLIENDDDNKVFNIVFRTVPKDSCGEAHIIEHTVLCGSRKYPSKDPFVELVKGSMNTFLNAMTYPDKTMFPVASTNDKDFANLMDVYLDAVFYPNIYRNENIFRQEGWSYQIEDKDDPVVYNGVVYNEMKGAYSSPDDVVERMIMNSLFPDTTYGVDSGGNPENIPDLTYENFLNFHRTYYHPSNSYIYLYGKMDFTERLEYLDRGYLSRFDTSVKVDSEIALQKPFETPKKVTEFYPVGEEEPLEKHTYLTRNTVVGEATDTTLAAAMDVLEDVLLEAPGAPLKTALIDAGIGMDVYGSYDSSTRQPVFSVVAKNAEAEDEEKFEEIIRKTLTKLADEGLNPKEIEASVNSMEFRYREADYGGFPKGLIYSIDVMDSWLYDEDKPFDYLEQQKVFRYLREKIGTGWYEQLIRDHLISNPHTTYVTIKPERGMAAKADEEIRKKLSAFKASLSDEEIGKLIGKTKELRAFQETPSTQEELEKIPVLQREDLGRSARPLSNIDESRDGIRLIRHDYQTNGIAYLTVLFDLHGLSQEELPYLGILKSILGDVDTEHYTYRDLATEIGRKTGGINPGVSMFTDDSDREKIKAAIGVQILTLPDQIDFAIGIAGEILLTSKFDDRKRIHEILQKLKSRISAQLLSAGHATSAQRVLSYFAASGVFNDGIGGIELYKTVSDYEEHFDEKYAELKEKLEDLIRRFVTPERMVVSYTGDASHTEQILEELKKLRGQILEKNPESRPADDAASAGAPDGTSSAAKVSACGGKDEHGHPLMWLDPFTVKKKNEGFRTASKIQYVSVGGCFPAEKSTGVLTILKIMMNYDYLWQNLRVVGGAYGCGGSFSRYGTAVFYSYRDPHLKNTLKVYQGIPEYIRNFQVSPRDMTKFVIGAISERDTPLTPRMAGSRSMNAYIVGTTFERMQKERDEILNAQPEDIRALAPLIEQALSEDAVCVIGSETKIDSEKDVFKEVSTL